MEIEEQHPIPQQVSAYQFKLVGDMTLQQFFQVAGGTLITLLLYSSGLPSFIKWPLIIISFLLGIALAFFPLEERPLAKWIVLFIKAIYSPTLYVWKQTSSKFSYFQPENNPPQPTEVELPATQTKSQVFQAPSDKLETEEQIFLDKVSKNLNNSEVKVSESVSFTNNPIQAKMTQRKDVLILKTENVSVEKQVKEDMKKFEENNVRMNKQAENYTLTPSLGQKFQNTQGVKFSPDAAPPLPPTKANVVVGQVVDPEGKIVENAILEIKDSEGRPVRALRSNKLGHFMIVTPLANGNYKIITEKEGLSFDILSLNASGSIIPPIAIWAKEKTEKFTG